MKKVIAFLCAIIISISTLGIIKFSLEAHIKDNYYDKFSTNLMTNKFKSIVLQEAGAAKKDNVMMFGSSEFENGRDISTHPLKFFKDKRAGFEVDLNGKAGFKCLVHAANFGAVGKSLKNKKVVFIVSPQWFKEDGIDEVTFEANSSELQVDGFLFNNDIRYNDKKKLASRILEISKKNPNKDFKTMRNLCRLYANDNVSTVAKRYILYPYYWSRFQLLTIKDDIIAAHMLETKKKVVKHIKAENKRIDWNNELVKANKLAETRSNNNPFGIANKTFNMKFKPKIDSLKDSALNRSYLSSPEYGDFKLLLQVCKDQGIKPLIVVVPVNGYWYDYTGFTKDGREGYYTKVKQIAKEYGVEVADFSQHEYDKSFLKDYSHLGWKGWVYVDEAIDKYYHENKR